MLFTAYIGENNVAHKIKKAYIGNSNGKAKTFYNPEAVMKFKSGSAPNLASARTADACSARVGNYALFAGGTQSYSSTYGKTNPIGTVDVYSNTLAKSTATAAHSAVDISSTNMGSYAIFAGGNYKVASGNNSYAYHVNSVCAYDSNLTKTQCANLNYIAGQGTSAYPRYVSKGGAVVNKFSLFNYGDVYSNNLVHEIVDTSTYPIDSPNAGDEDYLVTGSNYYYNKDRVKSTKESGGSGIGIISNNRYVFINGTDLVYYDKNMVKNTVTISYTGSMPSPINGWIVILIRVSKTDNSFILLNSNFVSSVPDPILTFNPNQQGDSIMYNYIGYYGIYGSGTTYQSYTITGYAYMTYVQGIPIGYN